MSDVSVSGFTIRAFKIKGKGENTAFVIDVFGARNATVVGNRITGNVASGIVFGKSVNTTIAKNHVIGSPETDQGILVDSSSRTKIVNNVVRSNVFGIDVNNSPNTTIAGNDSIGNVADGFGVIDSPGTKILSNVARRNDTVGIFLGDTQRANAKVVGNDLSGSDFGIFVSNSQEGSFAANEVHNNCAGMVFTSDFAPGPPSGNFAVKGNTVKDNTLSCAAPPPALSGVGIGLFGTKGMEVKANHLSGNVPSGPSVVSGGVVVGVDPLEGGTTKPMNNSVIGNHFGRNKPDIFWDESGSGNLLGQPLRHECAQQSVQLGRLQFTRNAPLRRGFRLRGAAFRVTLIHRSAWNMNSPKFISTILHSPAPLPLRTPSPDTPHSPASLELVTAVDRYARLWTLRRCKQMFVEAVDAYTKSARRPLGDRARAICV